MSNSWPNSGSSCELWLWFVPLQLEHYQGQMAELQEYVDYVRALNEVIQQCYRPLSPSEESLENMVRSSS